MEENMINNSEDTVDEKFGTKNAIIFGIGFLAMVVGFFLLSYTDPRGQNWASVLSPIMLVGSYITMGVAMVIK